MKGTIKKISINGFKSIRALNDLEFRDLNIIIGANGSGKSNLVQIFQLLMAITQKNLQKFILENGGADNFLHNGPRHTREITLKLEFEADGDSPETPNFYRCTLTPTVNETFLIREEWKYTKNHWKSYGPPSQESRLYDEHNETPWNDDCRHGVGHFIYESIARGMVYHFHDTSPTAPMRRSEIVEDNQRLRHNGSNIAPFLLKLKSEYSGRAYREIVETIRLVIPFFDDFRLDVTQWGEIRKVKLTWRQKGSDFPMQPYHLSDGSIRFICLTTALLQPVPPSMIVIDEPELGLHPEAIRVLGELITDAARRTQIIVATQSPLLVDQFAVENILVMNREAGQSTFERLQAENFSAWLDEYSVGELWSKNVIRGGSNDE